MPEAEGADMFNMEGVGVLEVKVGASLLRAGVTSAREDRANPGLGMEGAGALEAGTSSELETGGAGTLVAGGNPEPGERVASELEAEGEGAEGRFISDNKAAVLW